MCKNRLKIKKALNYSFILLVFDQNHYQYKDRMLLGQTPKNR